ncbi:MAG: universal stress protein [Pseudomonadota bacterium]|nr:universal stress protein [Pseudomonadota bacterium]
MSKVLACIDGSAYSQSVCEHAIWAARRLDAPLEFLHVLDRRPATAGTRDLSGSIGFDSQDRLLSELAQLDETRGRLAQQHGRQMLEAVVRKAREQGLADVEQRLRHGALVDTLSELEQGVRLFVLGKRGEHADFAKLHLGSGLERAVRGVHRPLLVASRQFKKVERVMLAFDGSETTRKGVEMIVASPLFKDLPCHVVMAGVDTAEARARLRWASDSLSSAGFEVHGGIRSGNAETVIGQYVTENNIDLLVMGAYGHSRVRQLIVGSTTTAMIRTCLIPVLLLR